MTTLRVPFLSADYFTLADSRSSLGDAFALGQNVIIVVEGVAYEVVGGDEEGDQIILPTDQDELENVEYPNSQSPPQAPSNKVEDGGRGVCPGAALTLIIVCIPMLTFIKKSPLSH